MAGLCLYLASCGTLIHPDRVGQPPGRLDAGIVILDAVGLLLFFVPGVIAFVVDFGTGAIYLPSERILVAPPTVSSEGMRSIRVDPAEMTPERLETVLREQTGQDVRLEPGTYRAAKINNINEFTAPTLENLQGEGTATRVIFRGSSR